MDAIINAISQANSFINNIVWGWPVIILILGTGLLLSIRTRFLQVRKFGNSLNETIIPTVKSIGKKKEKKPGSNTVSQFEAFSAAISGTVGTGNIIGVVAAILTGGPGAVFWMWVSAFFGMVTNYSENVLGLYFRKKDQDGDFSGGAFYYISYGLRWKWLGYVAALFCMLAAIGMSGVQTNKISGTIADSLDQAFHFENMTLVKLIIGIVVAILAAAIILGGIKRIGKVASMLVPFMSLLFIALALVAIFSHITAIGEAFGMIFGNAFNFQAAGGGIFGYAFAQTIKKGMARGVFSNEAGLGSSVIAHSASETREPVKQGLWGVFEVFFDTFIICTLTALMMLTTMDVHALSGAEADTATSLAVFSNNFGVFGIVAFSIILPLFAFTTIMAWSYYGEKATAFCFQWLGQKGQKIAVVAFKVIYVLLIVASSIIESDLVWSISDTANGLMAIPNLIALIGLNGLIWKITKNYYDRKKGLKVEPMLSAYPEMNEEFKKDLENEN
ncbi:MAG: alanine:cation symporter family protein [Clostridia bacterium]|nr:alanine:cation symporter family protein [Clostridia bacterium]